MTPSHSSLPRASTRSLLPRWLAGLCGISLLVAVSGCGGESDALPSTDTGNPPVIISQKLRVTATDMGVVVSGDPGAVPALARVDVTHVATGRTQTTTAQDDGSFEVELEGSVTDEYRVDATLGGLSSRTRLTSSGASDPEVGLAGLEFLLESAEGYVPVEGTTLRLRFEESQLSFDAGCNSHFGSYSVCDGRLCVQGLGSTDIGCGGLLQAQDELLASFFTSSPDLTHSGARLQLRSLPVTLDFLDRELADPDRPLAGPTWTIDTLIEGDVASSFPPLIPATVVFQADGSLQVFTTCNTGSGTYTVDAQALILSDVAYTEEGCGASGNVAAHQHIIRVLTDGTVSFEIEAARLTIQRGTLGLSARAD